MITTRPAFRFDNLHNPEDRVYTCNCTISEVMPFFDGHFTAMPIMPAAAQIAMMQELLRKIGINKAVSGGTGLKFTGRILPGDCLSIRLQCTTDGSIRFTVSKSDTVASKGILTLTGGDLG